nr:helix-turn-helix domain-containing protein [Gordonia desulfuricans]
MRQSCRHKPPEWMRGRLGFVLYGDQFQKRVTQRHDPIPGADTQMDTATDEAPAEPIGEDAFTSIEVLGHQNDMIYSGQRAFSFRERFAEYMSVESRSPSPDGNGETSAMLKIGQVAQLVGVSPSRIRLWESERLISPHRTPTGQRLFTVADVRRLERIRRLFDSKSMTAVGVRQALGADPDHPAEPADSDNDANPVLGARAKALRQRQHMSLRELSREIGMSPSALSSFERGQSKPSIGRITQIAHALGTTTPDLLGVPAAEESAVVRADCRKRLPLGAEGVIIENLYESSTVLQSQMVTVRPGFGSGEPMTHAGEEFLTVIEGEIELTLDGVETIELRTGDSMTFTSTRPHSYFNRSPTTARIVWVNTPPTF